MSNTYEKINAITLKYLNFILSNIEDFNLKSIDKIEDFVFVPKKKIVCIDVEKTKKIWEDIIFSDKSLKVVINKHASGYYRRKNTSVFFVTLIKYLVGLMGDDYKIMVFAPVSGNKKNNETMISVVKK